jgi:FkbM family methyltransferase
MGLFYALAQRSRTIIDVGAYVGLYALVGGHANPTAHVFAFEPVPHVFERLSINVAMNILDNVSCVRSAVARHVGSGWLRVPATTFPTGSSLSADFSVKKRSHTTPVQVSVTSLDGFCENLGLTDVDLVKIDTEGTEVDVLEGMSRVIERNRPTIISEVLAGSPTARIIQILGSYGYSSYCLGHSGPIAGWPGEVSSVGRNFLFTAADSQTHLDMVFHGNDSMDVGGRST